MRIPAYSLTALSLFVLAPTVALGALTDLSTTPLSGATSTEIKPNILFVMDDSGSMDWDYMPDWAGLTTERWKRRNPSFNGVAYNPTITYTPPKYFNADGSANTTTYPSQTATATSSWTAVKNDGYGVQQPLTSTTNLVGRAYYYTTVPGEYCTNKTLKSCSTIQDVTYIEPARLRWCTTSANATSATPATNSCQAIQVESTGSNTPFTFPRMPSPRQTTITISGTNSTSVSGITVGGQQILSVAVAATTVPLTMATNLAASINACTFGRTGNCQTEGYSAEISGTNLILRAPGAITLIPSVTKSGSMVSDPAAFSRPAPYASSGDNLLTVIAPSINSYPKAASRSDCAATDCTYDEEMTNFANWWAYYRTRMQAMKTAASRSFEPIIDKYRIGFYSINNNTSSDFLNISDFNVSQKKSWYDKLFASIPNQNTPLRVALAQAGRLYAGKLTTLNSVSVTDPVQYFCQQNVTILSTDGYWNEGAGFQIDGTSAIGDQDGPGLETRPQLDGGEPQIRTNTLQNRKTYTPETPWLQKRTEQQKKQTAVIERRDKENQVSNSTLQRRLGQWQTKEWQLQSRTKTIPLTSTLTQIQERTQQLQKRDGTLQRQTSTLQKRTKTQIQERTSTLQSRVIQRQQLVYRLQYRLTQVQQRTSSDFGENWTSWNNVASCSTDSIGADRTDCQVLSATNWTNVEDSSYSKCEPVTGGSQTFNAGTDGQYTVYTTKMECRYRNTTSAHNWPDGTTWSNTASCTATNPSATSPYTVLTARKCQDTYPAPGWQDATSCDASETLGCQYLDWSGYSNVASCTSKPRDAGPNFTGPARECLTGQWTPWADATGTCDIVTNSVDCQYTDWSTGVDDATCTGEPRSTGTSLSTLVARKCVVSWGNWSSNQPSCTTQSTGGTRRECQFTGTWSNWGNVGSCSTSGTAGTPSGAETSYTGPARECQTVWTTPTSSGPCTTIPGSTACTTQWTNWADVPGNGSCTTTYANADPANPNPNAPDGSVECGYRLAQDWYNTASCASNARSSHPNYTVNRAIDCQVIWPADANANWVNLSSGDTCNSALTDTQCRYSDWTNYSTDPTCIPASEINQSVATNYTVVTARRCRNDWGTWQTTALTTKPADSSITQYQYKWPATWTDTACDTGSLTELERCGTNALISDWSPSQPASAASIPPVDSGISCTEGTTAGGVVTLCRTLPRNPSLPIPSETCTEAAADPTPIIGNGNIATTCSTATTGPTNVASCPGGWPISASAGNSWTRSWCDSTPKGPTSDTLADVAEYYWKTDIRDSAYSNCTGGPVVSGGVSTNNNVCSNAKLTPREYNGSTLSGQYMNTYTLGLGASGLMQFQSDYKTAISGDFHSVRTGATANDSTCTWQVMGECNWPKPLSNKQTNIDDLWHAAVNGRGTYFSAGDPSAMAAGISSALQDVTVKEGALAAITVTSPNLTAGDSSFFELAFTAGSWTGDVQKYTISEVDGSISSTPSWAARSLLDTTVSTGTHTARKILTYNPGGESAAGLSDNLRDFLWANLSSTEKDYFRKPHIAPLSQLCGTGTICLSSTNQDLADEENLVNFLRGDRTNEGPPADTAKYFRQRTNLLGDIVNSEAIYVKKSPWNYADHQYNAFKTSNLTRTGMVYVGANDGMLHAFNADTGQETWAYIPKFLLPALYQLSDKNYGNLHRFFVDGTPSMGDICTENCDAGDSGTVWKTILVGGANQGGRGYYAIDITSPTAPKALWEFTDDNLGYSYGNPVITKLVNGTWVVLIASGYNNVSPGDGEGRLFVLDANTGTVIRSISTGVGTTTTPSGLAKISAWANFPDNNNTAQRVYGGDLLGNLWRFDINGIIPAGEDPQVFDAQRLATLKDASGNRQPITSRPELALVKNFPVVYVGTGQFLGNTDLSTSTQQSLYAIKDRLSTNDYGSPRPQTPAQTTPTPGNFVAQTMTSDADLDGVVDTCATGSTFCPEGRAIVSVSKNPVDWASKDGWYVDFPVLGERITSDIRLVQGTLAFTTNTPQSGACVPVGVSYSYFLDYMTGGYVEGTDGFAGFRYGDYLSTSPTLIRLQDGKIREITKGDCQGPGCRGEAPVPTAPSPFTTRRISWRELITD